jgi:transcriptional regulator GlxA family with amidase domain
MKFAIFIYPEVEPIDLATFGVLSMARRVCPEIVIHTVAPERGPVRLANGLQVIAEYGVDDAPAFDVIVVTGGPGWTAQAENPATLAFLRARRHASLLTSVCTGGMILAAAGVLDGKRATTKCEVVPPEISPLDRLGREYPAVEAVRAGLVDTGSVVTGGGVSLCIDAMLHLLKTRIGAETANETARIIEYSRAWQANQAALPIIET